MRYLSTVYVTGHRTKVSRSKGSLVTSGPEGSQRIPMEAIDAVVLLGGGHITTDALSGCVQRGIRVAALRRGGTVRFIVGGPQSGNVHLRVAQHQVSADPAASLDVARVIVAAKLQSSRRILMRWSRDTPQPLRTTLQGRADQVMDRLGAIGRARDADHLRGIEGDAARVYFGGMVQALADTPFRFSGRNRRPPRDPVNALLGFGYGLLLTEVTGAVEAAGLDHQIGFFHRPRSGRSSLSLDLMEEMRCLVDLLVVRTLRRRQLGPHDFVEATARSTYLSDHGRTRFLHLWEQAKAESLHHGLLNRPVERWALPSVQSTILARHLRGDLPSYAPWVHAR